jgi:TubC N-terminal docking domain
MSAPDLLLALRDQGFKLWAEGGRVMVAPKERITDETRALIRAHKAELLTALSADTLTHPAAEARRQRLLAMLGAQPDARYAVLTDTEAAPESIIVALAIRGRATCEFHIPRDKYDGTLLLDLIEKYGGTMH